MTQEKELPSFTEYDPYELPWTARAIEDVFHNYDYSKGIHEILCSGTVGSGKSLFGAHVAIRDIVEDSNSRWLLGRVSLPDAKNTIAQTMHDHIEGDFVEGEDYDFNIVKQKWEFRNGAEMFVKTWHNKRFKSFRSLKISGAIIEEATENDEQNEFWQIYDTLYSRLGRAKANKNILMTLTNPDSPAHPLYKRVIIGSETDNLKHVFYSDARENKFLEDWYLDNLIKNLSPIEIARLIEGRWVVDPKGGIYYNYNRERNFRNESYIFDLDYPIDLMHDFNIGIGKPMSMAVGQKIGGTFHIAQTFIVEGADTHEIMQEAFSSGILSKGVLYRIYGDASGKNRDTKSKTTDYEIIKNFLKRNRISHEMCVPLANPPQRRRHNRVNAKCCNYEGKVQLYIYKEAEMADTGFTLTKLKKGGQYLEDDTLKEQHVTTAIGYRIDRAIQEEDIEVRTSRFKAL